jgi:hypothetical protein
MFSSFGPIAALLQKGKKKKTLTAAHREADEAFARDPTGWDIGMSMS